MGSPRLARARPCRRTARLHSGTRGASTQARTIGRPGTLAGREPASPGGRRAGHSRGSDTWSSPARRKSIGGNHGQIGRPARRVLRKRRGVHKTSLRTRRISSTRGAAAGRTLRSQRRSTSTDRRDAVRPVVGPARPRGRQGREAPSGTAASSIWRTLRRATPCLRMRPSRLRHVFRGRPPPNGGCRAGIAEAGSRHRTHRGVLPMSPLPFRRRPGHARPAAQPALSPGLPAAARDHVPAFCRAAPPGGRGTGAP
jgi:hypothetical protein